MTRCRNKSIKPPPPVRQTTNNNNSSWFNIIRYQILYECGIVASMNYRASHQRRQWPPVAYNRYPQEKRSNRRANSLPTRYHLRAAISSDEIIIHSDASHVVYQRTDIDVPRSYLGRYRYEKHDSKHRLDSMIRMHSNLRFSSSFLFLLQLWTFLRILSVRLNWSNVIKDLQVFYLTASQNCIIKNFEF